MSLNETVFFFFIIIFLVSSLQPSTSVEITGSSCGIQPIRFPFCLNNQPISCGYPRFSLSCKNEAQAILTLPFSGDFSVVNIDYIFQYIRINDPDSCAAKHLIHGLNLSGTPFDLLHPRSYTFFNCSSDTTLTELKLPDAIYVSCLSGTAFSVVAKPTERLNSSASLLTTSCSEMATVLVPLSWTGSSDARDDIVLTWDEPDCKLCERRGGICLLKSDTGMDIGCFGGLSNDIFYLPRVQLRGVYQML